MGIVVLGDKRPFNKIGMFIGRVWRAGVIAIEVIRVLWPMRGDVFRTPRTGPSVSIAGTPLLSVRPDARSMSVACCDDDAGARAWVRDAVLGAAREGNRHRVLRLQILGLVDPIRVLASLYADALVRARCVRPILVVHSPKVAVQSPRGSGLLAVADRVVGAIDRPGRREVFEPRAYAAADQGGLLLLADRPLPQTAFEQFIHDVALGPTAPAVRLRARVAVAGRPGGRWRVDTIAGTAWPSRRIDRAWSNDRSVVSVTAPAGRHSSICAAWRGLTSLAETIE